MLDALSNKFEKILKKIRGQGVLTEQNIVEALKEVRLALLEADVNFRIVKGFIERVRQKAVGQEVMQSLTPGHQVVKVVWDELCEMMGRERSGISLNSQPPTVIMMIGLQGTGKTTTCGKLARLFKNQGKRVLLVAADPRRPAAGEQLSALGRDLGIEVHRVDQVQATQADVVRLCQAGVERGREQGFDLVVTAERVRDYKPSLAHFRYFARHTGAAHANWVHVACSWYHDIGPARELALGRVWLDRDRTGEDPSSASAYVQSAAGVPDAVARLLS